jgi:hypothetical protein
MAMYNHLVHLHNYKKSYMLCLIVHPEGTPRSHMRLYKV